MFPPDPPFYTPAQSPVPVLPHVHGGEQQGHYDGFCDSWWTFDGEQGPAYSTFEPTDVNAAVYYYPNDQQAATLWYHDHALGMTRLNVAAGLAGFYLVRDLKDRVVAPALPSGAYEMLLVIQDRSFNSDGSIDYPFAGINPDLHPYWIPEYLGNVIVVNGLVWPNMDVEREKYRFRILDGSNARFYTMAFTDPSLVFTVVGKDDGYLSSPVDTATLVIAPGERYDVIVDFSELPVGTQVLLVNTANAPFPFGDAPDPATTGQIMQFTVVRGKGKGKGGKGGTKGRKGKKPPPLPPVLNPPLAKMYPSLPEPSKVRIHVLNEIDGPDGPQEARIGPGSWESPVTELPVLGSTEDWIIIDATEDAHPMHIHLSQFQLVSRQPMDTEAYLDDWETRGKPDDLLPDPYFDAALPARPATDLEKSWYDTIIVYPGEATTIRVRWAPVDGGDFSFDATDGRYMWHCHILEHEVGTAFLMLLNKCVLSTGRPR